MNHKVVGELAASAQALRLWVLMGWVYVLVISLSFPDSAGTYPGCRRHSASMNRSPYFSYCCVLLWKQCLFLLGPEGAHFLRHGRGNC